MILSNTELFKALDAGRIVFTPEPSPRLFTLGEEHCPYDTHSVDLRLGDDHAECSQNNAPAAHRQDRRTR